jgi:hypothetical protein
MGSAIFRFEKILFEGIMPKTVMISPKQGFVENLILRTVFCSAVSGIKNQRYER